MTAPKRSNRKSTRETVADTTATPAGSVLAGDFPAPPPRPRHPVPMSQGAWRYSPGDGRDDFDRGVYRETSDDVWVKVAPLPYVLERLIRRDGYARRAGVDYRLAMTPEPEPGDVSVCDDEEIRTGAWASKLDVALSRDRKISDAAGTAIDYAARREAKACEITPRWTGGRFDMPSVDVGPPGYGAHTADESAARDVWREIGEIAARNPRVALSLGVSLGGMFVGPLRRQPFVLLLVGDARGGKTATLVTGAALYGDPEQLVCPWNTSPIGMTSYLGDLGCLPAYLDELGAAGLTPQKTEELIFRITQGAKRRTGTKLGGHKSSPPWHSTLLTTGNQSILGVTTNEGVAARVLELPAPITETAADAERLEVLALAGYGWPLRWLLPTLDLERVAGLVNQAETDLPLPPGGVPRTLGRHLALAVVGAELLAEITGITAIRCAALTAARELLERMISELAERGMTAGERLLAAVIQALTSRPAAFPTRAKYREGVDGTGFLPSRDVEGWLITDDRTPGDVAVLTAKLDAIAEASGIADTLPGLRDLRKVGVLLPSGESDGRLRRQLRVGARWKPDVYVFKLPDPDNDDQATAEPDQATAEPAETAAAPDVPAPLAEPAETAAPSAAPPDDQDVIVLGRDGPVWWVQRPPAPCRICGENAPATDDQYGPVHPTCATRAATTATRRHGDTATEEPVQEPASPQRQPATTTRARLQLAGAVDRRGLWLPGTGDPVPVDLSTVDAAYAAVIRHGIRGLWVHPEMHEPLGIPVDRPATDNPAAPFSHPWAESTTLELDPAGLCAWINVQPANGDGRRLALVFPGYESRAAWSTASDGRTLRDAVLTFARTVGEAYYLSPNETSAQIIIKSAKPRDKSEVDRLTPVTNMPAMAGNIAHLEAWSRSLTDEEDGGIFVQQYDLCGAELGVCTDLYVGIGDPVHRGPRQWTDADKKLAGYHSLTMPRAGNKLDSRLPDLAEYWRKVDAGEPAWIPTDLVVLLADLKAPFELLESWVWPKSFRTMRTYYQRMMEARRTLIGRTGEPDTLALKVSKTLYQSRIGDFNREGSRIERPDFRDAIKARRNANMYRRLIKVGEQSGRYPVAMYADAVYYVTDEPDPEKAAPAGLPLGTDLGEYKPEGTVPLAAVREHVGERGFHRYFVRELRRLA